MNIRAAKIVAMGSHFIGTNAEMQRFIEKNLYLFPPYPPAHLQRDTRIRFRSAVSGAIRYGQFLHKEYGVKSLGRFVLISEGIHVKIFPEQIV